MKKLLLLVLPLVLLSSCKKDSGEKNWVEDTDMLLDQVLNSKFRSIVNVPKDSRTYKHLFRLSEEAMTQATGRQGRRIQDDDRLAVRHAAVGALSDQAQRSLQSGL